MRRNFFRSGFRYLWLALGVVGVPAFVLAQALPPPSSTSGSTSSSSGSFGFVDAGRLSTKYAEIGYLDAGQVWSAKGSFGFVDAGRVSTGYAEIGSVDAGSLIVTGNAAANGTFATPYASLGSVDAGSLIVTGNAAANGTFATPYASLGAVDAGSLIVTGNAAANGTFATPYASIGYVDAGQIWTATANAGFVDAGTVWTNYVNAGSIDAGRIGVALAAIGGMDAGASYFSAGVSFSGRPAAPGADLTPAGGTACLAESSAQTDSWNSNIATGLSLTTLWGGIWDNPAHNANFFDGAHSYTGNSTNHPYQIRTNAIGRVTVFGGGNVAIGSQADDGSHKLQITGTESLTGALTSSVASGSNAINLVAGSFINLGGRTLKDNGSALELSSGIYAGNGVQNNSTTVPVGMVCSVTDAASRICATTQSQNTLTTASTRIHSFQNPQNTEKLGIGPQGKLFFTDTDSSGTPGNATANTVCGRAAIANGASSVVITSSQATAATHVFTQPETTGVGVEILVVTPGAGSFTVTSVSALGVATVTTGALNFSWCAFN